MKKLIYYLCILVMLVATAPSCSRVVNPEMSHYQKKNMTKFTKKKGRAGSNGSRQHPAVNRKYGTVW